MPKKFWQFRNLTGGSAELLLYGNISDRSWWNDDVTPKKFADDLNELGAVRDITVRINSGGGDVFAAQAIGNLLEQNAAFVTARIDGLCASAATVVASHCDKVIAANDSTYMVHPVQMGVQEYYLDAKTMADYIKALDTVKENIITLYAKKTGREKDELAGWMDATSWWTAEQAKENGFVDELVDEDEDTVVENRSGLLFINSVNMGLPFEDAPKFVQDGLAAKKAGRRFVNNQPGNPENEEENHMDIQTVDDLRGAYPVLVNQIEEAAATAARNEERQRIQEIEDNTLDGFEDMAHEAKFTKPTAANEFCMAQLKSVKGQGKSFLDKLEKDAKDSGASDVKDEEDKSGGDVFMNAIQSVGKNKKR